MSDYCCKCKFYQDDSCHRFPPQISQYRFVTDKFPFVRENDWCGEFKEKERAVE